MTDNRPRIRISDSSFNNCGASGIKVTGEHHIELEEVTADNNGEYGLNIAGNKEYPQTPADDRWYKKPFGIVALAVAAGLILAAAKWIAPYLYHLAAP